MSDERNQKAVFVIYGRDERSRREFYTFLRSAGLNPIEWEYAVSLVGEGSPYVGDILDKAFAHAQAVVVLLTPDDTAYLKEELASEDDSATTVEYQPRPNVLFEAGMAMAMHRDRTVIVEFGKQRLFSDIAGRHKLRLTDAFDSRQALLNRLKNAGCDVNLSGTDWHQAGDLTPPRSNAGNAPPLGKRLPKQQAEKQYGLDANFVSTGSKNSGAIDIVNKGRYDLFNVTVPGIRDLGLTIAGDDELPIDRLPAGKSVRCLHIHRVIGDHQKSYFDLPLRAETADGEIVESKAFISMGA